MKDYFNKYKDTIRPMPLKKDVYTIPEVMEDISNHFGIPIYDKQKPERKTSGGRGKASKKVNSQYRYISGQIRKFLKNYQSDNSQGERKTKYRREDIDMVVNDLLFDWLCEQSYDDKIQLVIEELRAERDKQVKLARVDPPELTRDELYEADCADLLRRKKIDIMLELFFELFVDFDEQAFLRDACDADNIQWALADGNFLDVLRASKLEDIRNYCKFKSPFAEIFDGKTSS